MILRASGHGLGNIETTEVHVLGAMDLASIIIYLLALAVVTIWVNFKVGGADSEHYFLGGRSVPFWAIGASLFASNLGTDHLVGLAGSGAASGLSVGNYEWSATYTLLLLGWVFVPHYLAYNIYTVPEYLEKRFSRRFRTLFTWLTIISTVFTKISVTIFAGAVVMKTVLGWNTWASSLILLALTAAYTTVGGLAAVVYTEVLQSIILVVGCLALLWYGLSEVGGMQGLRDKLPASHFTLLKPLDDPDFPWLGVLIGMPIGSIWYWCTDQVMVQRVLATKEVYISQQACVFAGWLKVLPMYLMVLPGLVAAALYPGEIAKDSNGAFAILVTRLLPSGWQGPMIAVMLSSFMAALASCFNSCSTLFTIDIYAHLRPGQTEAHLVRTGRAFTVLLACVSLAWLPVIENSDDQLFLYIQGMQTIWSAPVATVFLASVTSDALSEWTAWWSLIAGLMVGFLAWLLREIVPVCARGPVCWILRLNILHFSIGLLILNVFVLLVLHLGVDACFLVNSEQQQQQQQQQHLEAKSSNTSQISTQQWAGWPSKVCSVALLMTVASLTAWYSL